MIKELIKKVTSQRRIFFLRKVGLGKLILNFIIQRVFRVNSQVICSVNYTSTFIGDKLFFEKRDVNTLVSFASSNSLYIQSLNGIYIGEGALIAPGVKIVSANHAYSEKRESQASKPVIIGKNVWLGASSIILPGVKIGDKCVIGAGSVVTKSFPESGLVIAGNPAKVIKKVKL